MALRVVRKAWQGGKNWFLRLDSNQQRFG